MISWLAKQLRYLFGFLWTHDSPRQIALGLALGVVLGMTPKGNLLAALLASLLLAVRVNAQAGMLAAVLVSFVAHLGDPLADRIGHSLLTLPAMRPLWTQLYNIPLAPWTGFNHTLVLGSFVLGWLLFYPVYRVALPVATRWQLARDRWLAARQAKNAPANPASHSEDAPATIGFTSSPEAMRARELLRKRRFREFVAEVESLSQRRGAA